MKHLFYENKHITITYDEAIGLGMCSWRGFVSGEEYRSAMLQCLEIIKRFNLTRFLSDNRHMKAIRQQDQQWTVDVFKPLVQQSPLQYLAVIASDDLFNKMAVEDIVRRAGPVPSPVIREFENAGIAFSWLESVTHHQQQQGQKPTSH